MDSAGEQAPRRHRRGALLRRNPRAPDPVGLAARSEEHTSELQSQFQLVCRLLLEKKNLPSALQVPMSSQPKSPRTTATFLLRSSTALSTEIGLGTAAKNSDASPSSSSDNAFLSSTACCFA